MLQFWDIWFELQSDQNFRVSLDEKTKSNLKLIKDKVL